MSDQVQARKKQKTERDLPANPEGSEPEGAGSMLNGPVQRYLITLEYIGTSFLGWQKQKTGRTVQGVLEDAFQKFVGQPVAIAGSSRTDTGVHALGNVCHADVQRISKHKPGEVLPPHEPEVVLRALNSFLRRSAGDVAVTGVKCIPPDFHARFRATERTYHYRIISGVAFPSIFDNNRAWHVPEVLDLKAMQAACRVLEGRHDFSSFRASGCQAKSPLKTLTELSVVETRAWSSFPTQRERDLAMARISTAASGSAGTSEFPEREEARERLGSDEAAEPMGSLGPEADDREAARDSGTAGVAESGQGESRCYVVTARARSFLYHQVRLMVGTLKAVGAGVISLSDVQRILEAGNVTKAPAMASAVGLYLAEVSYNTDRLKANGSEAEEADVNDD